MNLNILFNVIFLLPGTFLHECAHAFVALLVGKVTNFTLLPIIKNRRNKIERNIFEFYLFFIFFYFFERRDAFDIKMGSVDADPKYKVLFVPIALAPLTYWIVLYFLIDRYYETLESASIVEISLFGFVGWQLLWAGKPSAIDLRAAFNSLFFSVSGIDTLAIALLLYFGKDKLVPYAQMPINFIRNLL